MLLPLNGNYKIIVNKFSGVEIAFVHVLLAGMRRFLKHLKAIVWYQFNNDFTM